MFSHIRLSVFVLLVGAFITTANSLAAAAAPPDDPSNYKPGVLFLDLVYPLGSGNDARLVRFNLARSSAPDANGNPGTLAVNFALDPLDLTNFYAAYDASQNEANKSQNVDPSTQQQQQVPIIDNAILMLYCDINHYVDRNGDLQTLATTPSETWFGANLCNTVNVYLKTPVTGSSRLQWIIDVASDHIATPADVSNFTQLSRRSQATWNHWKISEALSGLHNLLWREKYCRDITDECMFHAFSFSDTYQHTAVAPQAIAAPVYSLGDSRLFPRQAFQNLFSAIGSPSISRVMPPDMAKGPFGQRMSASMSNLEGKAWLMTINRVPPQQHFDTHDRQGPADTAVMLLQLEAVPSTRSPEAFYLIGSLLSVAALIAICIFLIICKAIVPRILFLREMQATGGAILAEKMDEQLIEKFEQERKEEERRQNVIAHLGRVTGAPLTPDDLDALENWTRLPVGDMIVTALAEQRKRDMQERLSTVTDKFAALPRVLFARALRHVQGALLASKVQDAQPEEYSHVDVLRSPLKSQFASQPSPQNPRGDHEQPLAAPSAVPTIIAGADVHAEHFVGNGNGNPATSSAPPSRPQTADSTSSSKRPLDAAVLAKHKAVAQALDQGQGVDIAEADLTELVSDTVTQVKENVQETIVQTKEAVKQGIELAVTTTREVVVGAKNLVGGALGIIPKKDEDGKEQQTQPQQQTSKHQDQELENKQQQQTQPQNPQLATQTATSAAAQPPQAEAQAAPQLSSSNFAATISNEAETENDEQRPRRKCDTPVVDSPFANKQPRVPPRQVASPYQSQTSLQQNESQQQQQLPQTPPQQQNQQQQHLPAASQFASVVTQVMANQRAANGTTAAGATPTPTTPASATTPIGVRYPSPQPNQRTAQGTPTFSPRGGASPCSSTVSIGRTPKFEQALQRHLQEDVRLFDAYRDELLPHIGIDTNMEHLLTGDRPDDVPFCRRCGEVFPFVDLFAPCNCEDMHEKYVHRSCLEAERRIDAFAQGGIDAEFCWRCRRCRARYQIAPNSISVFGAVPMKSPLAQTINRLLSNPVAPMIAMWAMMWVAGYLVKVTATTLTLDYLGAYWGALRIYHWVLGAMFLLSFALCERNLRHFFDIFNERTKRSVIMVFAALAPMLLGYIGHFAIVLVLSVAWSWESFYCLGVFIEGLLCFYVLPELAMLASRGAGHLYDNLPRSVQKLLQKLVK